MVTLLPDAHQTRYEADCDDDLTTVTTDRVHIIILPSSYFFLPNFFSMAFRSCISSVTISTTRKGLQDVRGEVCIMVRLRHKHHCRIHRGGILAATESPMAMKRLQSTHIFTLSVHFGLRSRSNVSRLRSAGLPQSLMTATLY